MTNVKHLSLHTADELKLLENAWQPSDVPHIWRMHERLNLGIVLVDGNPMNFQGHKANIGACRTDDEKLLLINVDRPNDLDTVEYLATKVVIDQPTNKSVEFPGGYGEAGMSDDQVFIEETETESAGDGTYYAPVDSTKVTELKFDDREDLHVVGIHTSMAEQRSGTRSAGDEDVWKRNMMTTDELIHAYKQANIQITDVGTLGLLLIQRLQSMQLLTNGYSPLDHELDVKLPDQDLTERNLWVETDGDVAMVSPMTNNSYHRIGFMSKDRESGQSVLKDDFHRVNTKQRRHVGMRGSGANVEFGLERNGQYYVDYRDNPTLTETLPVRLGDYFEAFDGPGEFGLNRSMVTNRARTLTPVRMSVSKNPNGDVQWFTYEGIAELIERGRVSMATLSIIQAHWMMAEGK